MLPILHTGSIPPRPDGRYPDWVASDSLCSALFDACPFPVPMKVRPVPVGRRWTKPGEETAKRGEAVQSGLGVMGI
jgi:hypothetical protein